MKFDLSQYRKHYQKKIFGVHQYAQRLDKISKYLIESKPNSHISIHDFCINHPNRILNHIRLNESDVIYINEGLIKTYPIEKLVSVFRSWFHRKIDTKFADISFADIVEKHNRTNELDTYFNTRLIDIVDVNEKLESENTIVTFYFPFEKDNALKADSLLHDLCDSLYVCGYNLASNEVIEFDDRYLKRNDVSVMYVTFEPKFSDYDFEFSEYLYHITPAECLRKIAKNGLVPKSKHGFFKYPDRVYLFNNCSMNLIIDYGIDISDRSQSHKFAMLRVKSKELMSDQLYLNGKMKFYVDQKYPMIDGRKPIAIYTYANVPFRLLERKILVFDVNHDIIVNKMTMDIANFV